jgi:GNAT superfamily N-acetyltransferase
MTELRIRQGSMRDFDAVLGLLDEAVEWLVARDQTGQWGSVPFSQLEDRRERMREIVADGDLHLALLDEDIVGALVVGDRPAHVSAVDRPELYIDLLVTSRRHSGEGIGSRLIDAAISLAREAGVDLLRVDCWAGAPTLVAWYERQGFVPSDIFELRGWRGQVFEMEF